ncbi:acetoin utilization protein AcuC [Arenibaculum pallidiluteum]|uniref:acetoin utilization protein AcuC n=1 Tax=Arenibaculum pallidiluteum TaxID=2812559 RepID=UPI001A96CDBE|nr:acetoin utilization protein AcuC [Arenibaculum pallidiluteum]
MLSFPLLIGSEIYRHSTYGRKHPLSIPRVSTAIDLCSAMGWLRGGAYRDSPRATTQDLARFHDPGYIAVLQRAEAEQRLPPELAARHNLGRVENPIFPEVFSRPATAAGASLLGAELILEGGTVYSPAGGTHHGRADRASGFCYLNDPVLAILRLLDRGLGRIYYVDLDAHHGDGVQDAFADDARVLTVSVHEAGRWPRTGPVEDRAGGQARNLPVLPGFNDSEMGYVVEHALLPLGRAFEPEAIVIQCGADALADDPLSRLELSNRALWDAVAALLPLAPRRLVLGGGGYNPWSVGRCWAGIWATVNGIAPDTAPTPEAEAVLRALTWSRRQGENPPGHWFTTIADAPRPGPVRDETRAVVAAVLAP